MIAGTNFTLFIGSFLPVPASPSLMDAFESASITVTDQGTSGFQMVFEVGRGGGVAGALDYVLLAGSSLKPFARVIMMITMRAIPRVIFDGVITNIQSAPSNEPGATKITVTGEDLSVMMDRVEESRTHRALPDAGIVAKILLKYSRYGLRPMIIPPINSSPPSLDRHPTQKGTDLQYLRDLAKKHNHVFYVAPGRLPGIGTAYWGPAPRVGIIQPALTQNMGAMTNLNSISFQNNATQPTVVSGRIQDRDFNIPLPVFTFASTRIPLAPLPSLLAAFPNMRRKKMEEANGDKYRDAYSKAQAETNNSTEDAVTATGELDATTYGRVLEPRKLVGVRGVGFTYDGIYYVKQVEHKIKRGSYTQSFKLSRDGTGSFTPILPV